MTPALSPRPPDSPSLALGTRESVDPEIPFPGVGEVFLHEHEGAGGATYEYGILAALLHSRVEDTVVPCLGVEVLCGVSVAHIEYQLEPRAPIPSSELA